MTIDTRKLNPRKTLKPYTKPILKEFGDIKQTTHGSGSGSADGGSGMGMI